VELAARRPRFGYRRLAKLLKREGYPASHKRVYRPYKQGNLALRLILCGLTRPTWTGKAV